MVTYREDPRISQSQLKLLLGPDPSIFNTIEEPDLYFEEKKHFLIGDGVDIQLTQSLEAFNNKFHVSNIENKPSDTVKSIVNQVYDTVKNAVGVTNVVEIHNYRDDILVACEAHQYQERYKDDTKYAKICEAWEYWEDLKAAEGKSVLSQEESSLISQIVMNFRTSENTKDYFLASKDKEILYQLPIFFKFKAVECKALLDMVIIDHTNKTIQPIDIKTMGDNTLYFTKSLKQRRYDIQAAFYTQALFAWILQQELYSDYKILNFKFLVESTITPGNPLVYTCDNSLLHIGMWGREENALNLKVANSAETWEDLEYQVFHEIKGINQLLDDYKWYLENGFEVNRKIVENKGAFNIDWHGIIN